MKECDILGAETYFDFQWVKTDPTARIYASDFTRGLYDYLWSVSRSDQCHYLARNYDDTGD